MSKQYFKNNESEWTNEIYILIPEWINQKNNIFYHGYAFENEHRIINVDISVWNKRLLYLCDVKYFTLFKYENIFLNHKLFPIQNTEFR